MFTRGCTKTHSRIAIPPVLQSFLQHPAVEASPRLYHLRCHMTFLVALSVKLRVFVYYICLGRSCPLASSVDVDFTLSCDQIIIENPNVLNPPGREIQLVLIFVTVRILTIR